MYRDTVYINGSHIVNNQTPQTKYLMATDDDVVVMARPKCYYEMCNLAGRRKSYQVYI